MSICIVIVNWNAGDLLLSCIKSVIKSGGALVSQIIVVDNNSSDGSVETLNNLAQVNLIQADENLGFGRACNLGATYCTADYVLFLNPDARIYDDTLRHVLAFMEEKENLNFGICGVQLENQNKEITRSSSRSPSVLGFLSHSTGLDKIYPNLGNPMAEWDHSSTRTVDQVIGAFFFVRSHVFERLNGFDERFFVYFEEVDFSVRAKRLGWPSVYFAGAKAFHLGGGVSQQVKAQRLFYSRRSRLQYIWKHFSLPKIILVSIGTLFVEPIGRIMSSILRKSFVSFKETMLGYGMLYKWIFFRLVDSFR